MYQKLSVGYTQRGNACAFIEVVKLLLIAPLLPIFQPNMATQEIESLSSFWATWLSHCPILEYSNMNLMEPKG